MILVTFSPWKVSGRLAKVRLEAMLVTAVLGGSLPPIMRRSLFGRKASKSPFDCFNRFKKVGARVAQHAEGDVS